ncbi:acetyltransferase [Pelotalea chapellei]|uniref:Acetyltransferase n=1 Tax=Pelotalea chapellei TaxID=44671 RepID=A0ABS5U5B3_9BACT|nr:acetyltransferase [Pelotalea chapellei]MBT1070852.1 acetyltransferase [Pelotalea chapellei]
MSKKLFLFPYGGNSREALLSVLAINEQQQEEAWDVIGFLDDNKLNHGKECCGITVVGGREMLGVEPDAFLLAVPGSPTSYAKRAEVITGLPVDESRFATIIHPSVQLPPDCRIGFNCIIMPNVFISSNVTVGNHCVILPNTVISHDSVIGDYCCIGSNVSVSGSVNMGKGCYIGSGSRMREHVSIGAGSLVGLGSAVLKDIPEQVIAAGSPARVLKEITADGVKIQPDQYQPATG